MEPLTAALPEPMSPRSWVQVLRHLAIVLLAALVFASVFLYFPELVLLVKFPGVGWLALLFALVVFFRSLFLTASWTRRWFGQQEGLSKVLFALIVLTALLLALIGFGKLVRALEPVYGERFASLQWAELPSYLRLRGNVIDSDALEQRIHGLVNEERTKQGLRPLAYDAALAAIAQKHSEDMAQRLYLEHLSPEGVTAIQRGEQAGYPCDKRTATNRSHGIGENLALIPLGNVAGCGSVYNTRDVVRCTVRGWMDSEEHRKNILASTYESEGIGVALAENKRDYYITQNFC